MAQLGPAYLIHGDDHGAVAERRASLRALAEREGQASSVEYHDGDASTPQAVADALRTMTFAVGQRVIIVDGVERWKEADVREHLIGVMRDMPPHTTLALFAREEGRSKVPPSVHKAVRAAGGQVAAHLNVKPWELPKWVREQAATMGLAVDPEAAKALVAIVGERQQRLVRELEKLALSMPQERQRRVTVEDVELHCSGSQQSRIFALADALVDNDVAGATRCYLRLRDQGERLSGCLYLVSQSMRDALAAAERLADGVPPADVKRGMRMAPRAADRMIASIRRSSPERLRGALTMLADLEMNTRGGAILTGHRSALASLSEDTLGLLAFSRIQS